MSVTRKKRSADSAKRAIRLDSFLLFCASLAAMLHLPSELVPQPAVAISFVIAFVVAGVQLSKRLREKLEGLLAAAILGAIGLLSFSPWTIVDPSASFTLILVLMLGAFVRVQGAGARAGRALLTACLTLIAGIVLSKEAHAALVVAFVVSASLAMHFDARRHAGAPRVFHVAAATGASWFGPLRVVLASGLSVAAILLILAEIPELNISRAKSQQRSGRTGASSQTGLSSSFDLSGGGAELLLRVDRVLRVATLDREALASDLYLRNDAFELPSLSAWRKSPQRGPNPRVPRLRGAPTRRIEVTALEELQGLVFVPPGTIRVSGLTNVRGNLADGRLRAPAPGPTRYSATYHDLRPFLETATHDRRLRELAELPDDAWHPIIERLALRWIGPRDQRRPLRVTLSRIARGLRQHCTYALRAPKGPHNEPTLDFLDGDRHGYCMHFSAAAGLLLRWVGIPCRIAIGFYGGDEEGGARVYGSSHAHAWVEVGTQNLGWTVFDPTPPSSRGLGLNPDEEDGSAVAPRERAEADDTTPSLLSRLAKDHRVWALVGASIVLLWLFSRWRPRRRAARSQRAEERRLRPARELLERILEALAASSLARRKGESLEDYGLRLHLRTVPQRANTVDRIRDAFLAYQELRFGGRQWGDAHEERMRSGLDAAIDLGLASQDRRPAA